MNPSLLSTKTLVAVAASLFVLGSTSAVAYFLTRTDPVEELTQALGSEDDRQRYKAAKELEELGPSALAALDGLMVTLQDPSRDVRYRSAKAISRMGKGAAAAAEALRKIPGTEDRPAA